MKSAAVVDAYIDGDFASWRTAARSLLQRAIPPGRVVWHERSDNQVNLLAANEAENEFEFDVNPPTTLRARVSPQFLEMAASVSCHADSSRWDALYRVLFRLVNGEPSLLEVATDPDVHRIMVMNKTVRREVHKMHAFVRFRSVETIVRSDDGCERTDVSYVAWFEPEHPVVQRAVPLFTRRFPSMRWSVLTPHECAHWDGNALHFTPGVSRAVAPTDDVLEELWRSYYANIFNPARVGTATMQAEMPQRYWVNLPEARLIGSLTRDAPARVSRMLAQLNEPAATIPIDLSSQVGDVTVPERVPVKSVSDIPASLLGPGSWDVVHDPGVHVAAQRSASACATVTKLSSATAIDQAENVASSSRSISLNDVSIRLGTASWTDPTLLYRGVYYPDTVTTPEARLKYYADRHALVEIDSTYYVPPVRSVAAAWAERTPQDFVFDVKAYALMTGHAAEVKRMPDWLRRMLPRTVASSERVYGSELRSRIIDEVWARFLSALSPLESAGKLGPILLQFPRWFEPSRANAAFLRLASERLGGASAAVEFRNPAWVEGRIASRTVALLEKLQLTYVVVDAPPGTASSMPPFSPVTTPALSMVRLHGRRTAAWEAKHSVVSERYRYLYDRAELTEWVGRINDITWRLDKRPIELPDMAKAKQGVHVVFNNCHANYGTTNTDEITQILIEFDRQRRGILD